MKTRSRRLLGPLLALTVFMAVVWLLRRELQHYELQDFLKCLANTDGWRLAAAAVLTLLNYCVLVGYDVLGVHYIQRSIPLRRTALGSYLGYAIGHTLGTLLGGATVRYRLYSSWGLSGVEIVKLVLVLGATYWLGVCTLAGTLLLASPIHLPARLGLPFTDSRPLGAFLLANAIAYLTLCAVRRKPFQIGTWQVSPPPLPFSLLQCLVASLDLTLVGGVIYVLLPSSVNVSLANVVAVYVLSTAAALTAQVPAGAGVVELFYLVVLEPAEPDALIGALLAFRLLYQLGPVLIALIIMGMYELQLHRTGAQLLREAMGVWAELVAPRLWALFVFLGGTIVLLSGALPAAGESARVARLGLPPSVVEASAIIASLAGFLLLLLARGLQRRVMSAYRLCLGALVVATISVSVRDGGFLFALVPAVILLLLPPCGHYFYRREARLLERFYASWTIAIALVLASAAWVAVASQETVFGGATVSPIVDLTDSAARPLRALLAVFAAIAAVLATRFLRGAQAISGAPQATRTALEHLVRESPKSTSQAVLLGDKPLLLSTAQDAAVVYGETKRAWVAIGSPLGNERSSRELAWQFRERCDDNRVWPVFFEIDQEETDRYVEMDLEIIKVSEEAIVPLDPSHFRHHVADFVRERAEETRRSGCSFAIVLPHEAANSHSLDNLDIDAWRSGLSTPQPTLPYPRWLSGGADPAYLRSVPVAVARHDRSVVGVAPMWLADDRTELSADYIATRPNAVPGILEYIIWEAMAWGISHGYRQFNLGTAPSSDPEPRGGDPFAGRLNRIGFRHGEHFPDDRSLRRFKQHFGPHWRVKYLASPVGFSLPLVLEDVAALVTGSPGEAPGRSKPPINQENNASIP